MKYLNIILCVMMLAFIAVQYNDPDGLTWGLIYLVPTVWAGLAAFRLDRVTGDRSMAVMALSVVGTIVLTAYYWPTTAGFWRQDVWWETETAREGMGMMIATFVMLIAAWTIWSARKKTT
jgi:hypothetical protein